MTTTLTIEDVARKLTDAWNSHDAARVAACYAHDATVIDPFYPEPLEGREAIEKDAAGFFSAFPDIRFHPTKVIKDGETVALEATVTATNAGPLHLPTGLIPATRRRVELRAAGFSVIDAMGNIREEHRYFDVAGILTQLGLLQ